MIATTHEEKKFGFTFSILLALVLVWGGFHLARSLVGPKVSLDFTQYYIASRMVLEGQADLIYNREKPYFDKAIQYAATASGDVMTNAYPPFMALILTPLALLPFSIACWIFYSLNILWTILGVYFFVIRCQKSKQILCLALALAFIFFPVYQSLYLGQINCFLFFLCSLCFFYSKIQKHYLAGFLLAIASLIKIFPAGLLLFFLLRKQYKLVISCIFFMLFLSILTLPIVGLSCYTEFIFRILPQESSGGSYWANQGFAGVFLRACTENEYVQHFINSQLLAKILTLFCSIIAIIYLLWLTYPRPTFLSTQELEEIKINLEFSLYFICFLLILTKSWTHYGIFLLFGFFTVLYLVWCYALLTYFELCLVSVSFSLWTFVFTTRLDHQELPKHVLFQPIYSLKFFATLILFVVIGKILMNLRKNGHTVFQK